MKPLEIICIGGEAGPVTGGLWYQEQTPQEPSHAEIVGEHMPVPDEVRALLDWGGFQLTVPSADLKTQRLPSLTARERF